MPEYERNFGSPETPLQKGVRSMTSQMEQPQGFGYWTEGYSAYYEVLAGPDGEARMLPLITQIVPDLTGNFPGRRTYRATLLNGRNSIAARFSKPYDRGRVNGFVSVTRPDIHPDQIVEWYESEEGLGQLCRMVNDASLLSPVEEGYEEIELDGLGQLLEAAKLVDGQVDPHLVEDE